jgi:hypothetical protein
MGIERTGTWGTFSTDYLDNRNAVRLPTDKAVHEQLFDQTRQHYEISEIFSGRDELEVSEETFRNRPPPRRECGNWHMIASSAPMPNREQPHRQDEHDHARRWPRRNSLS